MSATGDALTLVIPLRARNGIALEDFYEYWLNAHVTLPARFPGISSIWLHSVSFAASKWPAVPGTSSRPDAKDELHGVPEATFPTLDDLGSFVGAARVQMEDGIHFLSECINYRSLRGNSVTLVDRTGDKAPDGHDGKLRHLIFLRRKRDLAAMDVRRFVTEKLGPAFARSPEVLKVRYHLFEELEGTLDHPGVALFKPPELQYQAVVEVVMEDERALERFVASPAWTETAEPLGQLCESVHAARVERCITTKHDGTMTLAGIRGVAVADVIKRLEAQSQRHEDVSRLFHRV